MGVYQAGQDANNAPQFFSNTVSVGALEAVVNGVTFGTATLAGTGGVTVSTTAVQSNSMILLGAQASGLTTACYVSTVTPGSSFVIKSIGTDTAKVAWMIINPA